MLEAVPGLIVTQHRGEGKANQYFLRGFNLDHGTDLAIWLDGMPINMRTHAPRPGLCRHQLPDPRAGRADDCVRKGPYWAQEGDFSSAGALRHRLRRPAGEERVAGDRRQLRLLARARGGHRLPLGQGTLTGAGEIVRLQRAVGTSPTRCASTTASCATARARRQRPFPHRAGLHQLLAFDRPDPAARRRPGQPRPLRRSVDPTDGGDTQRYSLSMRWRRSDERTADRSRATAIYSTLNLYNNFTYFLNDPVNGDQFQQSDKRKILGRERQPQRAGTSLRASTSERTFGMQVRNDDIGVGLFNTFQRMPTIDHPLRPGERDQRRPLRRRTRCNGPTGCARPSVCAATCTGVRQQQPRRVTRPDHGLPAQPQARRSCSARSTRRSSIINAGLGFHSNDVRGATITVNPADRAQPLAAVPLLVRSTRRGSRRAHARPSMASIRRWRCSSSTSIRSCCSAAMPAPPSPAGRAGGSASNGPTAIGRRPGRCSTSTSPTPRRASPTTIRSAATSFPGRRLSSPRPASRWASDTGWFGALRWRYFGPRPLIEDGSVYSALDLAVQCARRLHVRERAQAQSRRASTCSTPRPSQIDYYYTSRLPGEPLAGVNDVHFHPVEPLALRFTLAKAF